MKVTISNKTGKQYEIETPRYEYMVYKEGKLYPKSVKFKAALQGTPKVKGLDFADWMASTLNNKIVTSSTPSESEMEIFKSISPLEDPLLIVKSVETDRITFDLFSIINKLNEPDRIESLEYEE